MKMNLSKFRKISEDERTARLRHPAGHEITIAKHVLSPDLKSQLSELPMHYAEGDLVKKDQPTIVINNGPQPNAPLLMDQQPSFDPQKASMNLLTDPSLGDQAKEAVAHKQGLQMNADQINQNLPQTGGRQLASESLKPETPKAPQAQESPMDAYGNVMSQGLNLQTEGIAGQAAGEMGQNQMEADALQGGIGQEQTRLKLADKKIEKYDQERADLQKDMANFHFDPERHIKNMSTGSKIMTAIGLIFGGMGQGLAGGDNPAQTYLQKQIDNDIQAQKDDFGKRKSLLFANMENFKNMKDATDMTRIMLGDIVSQKIKLAAAQSQNPIIQSRALQSLGKLQTDNAMTLSMMKARAAQSMGGDQSGQMLDFLRVANPQLAKNYEQRYVPSVGMGQVPVPDKAREEIITRSNLDQSVADLQKFAEQHQGTTLDRSVVAEGSAKAKLVQDAYRRANAQGVFREAEKNFVEGIVDQDPTKFFGSFRTLPKYQQLRSDNLRQLNGLKKGYGLPSMYVPPSAKPYEGK